MAKFKTAPRKIFLIGQPNQMEREAGGAITPGMLVEIDSSDNFIVHNTAGGICSKMVAVESAITGDDIDHPYATGEVTLVNACRTGDEVLLRASNGEAIVIGSFLESDGAGAVQVATEDSAGATEYSASVVAVAVEAKDMSDSSAADPTVVLFRARIV